MGVVLGATLTPLDGRFTTVRTAESNLCDLLCDVLRRACSADVCIMNSGTFRWDCVCAGGGGGRGAVGGGLRGVAK